MESFTGTLHSWQNFYFMTGGAAGGLLGLMFVALSLAANFIDEDTPNDMKAFVTPSVFYFVSALLLSCAMLVPDYTPLGLTVILSIGSIIGAIKTLTYMRHVIRAILKNGNFNLTDWLSQVILPIAAYGLILLAAVCLLMNQPSLTFAGLWLANIALLVAAIGNTWNLVVWVVDQRVK